MSISMAFALEGKVGGVTYFDYTNAEDISAFNFNRQYFTYVGKSHNNDLRFAIVFDVGRTNNIDGEDTRLATFLKKAQVDYITNVGTFNLGLIGMNTYVVQETTWGYRFIEKSAIDRNKFSSTADLGIGFSRSLNDNFNISLQIVNGEGFKSVQGDKYHKISFNATYGERKLNTNDGFNVGVVYSTEASDTDPTDMISLFGGFSGMGFRVGAEYDILTQGEMEEVVISTSMNYGIKENVDAYLRYDMYDDNNSDMMFGNTLIITGLRFNCGNGLTVAPNIRMYGYEDESIDTFNEYKVNFQFKF
jgi:hypothetical protein